MKIVALFLVIVFVVSGCGSHIQISEIKAKPQEYKDKQVSVKGKVVETFSIPFVRKGMYQVDDGTDKIWIASQEMPVRDDEVTVKGKVKTGFTIGGKIFGTVIAEGGEEQED